MSLLWSVAEASSAYIFKHSSWRDDEWIFAVIWIVVWIVLAIIGHIMSDSLSPWKKKVWETIVQLSLWLMTACLFYGLTSLIF